MNNKLKESVAKALIELKNISKIYKRNNTETKALNDINLHINKGDIFGVIGFSGAGKSTLIRLVNYLEKPTTGKVVINNHDLSLYPVRSEERRVGKEYISRRTMRW